MREREVPENLKRFECAVEDLCANRFVSMRDDTTPIQGHLECDAGWWPLIVALDAALLALDPNYKVVQIKEKFGGLRYYVMQLSNDLAIQNLMLNLISKAEGLSYKICERTGEEGRCRIVRGWWKTLSDDALIAHLKEKGLPYDDLSVYGSDE